jgi:hypothetical protein
LGRSGKNSGELMSSNGFVSIFLKKSEGENILLFLVIVTFIAAELFTGPFRPSPLPDVI